MDLRKTKSPASPPTRDIRQSKIWQQTVGACQQIWSNYLNVLRRSFTSMSRADQYELITKLSRIVTIGVAALATSFFYSFLPQLVRVIALPIIIVGAWWLGSNVVPNVIINKFEKYLNQQ